MTLNPKEMRAYGFGNMTAFFKHIYYTYHDGAMREVKVTKVLNHFKTSRTCFRSTYPCNSDTGGEYKFVFKIAGVNGTYQNTRLYLDPLREKEISVFYTAVLAITDWLGKPQLLNKDQSFHLGGELFEYNTIEKGAFVIRRGFITRVIATPDDVVVDILTGEEGVLLSPYDTFDKATKLSTISLSDRESVKEFTKSKEDIRAELATKIVKFSDEEKRAEEEKLNNVIGSLHAGIQALVNDYAKDYPVSVVISVGGQTDKI